MQGHVPVPPQPHFPDGLAPFIGYIATREPRGCGERPPEETGWGDMGGTALDVFDDVGEWEPMRRPFFKVLAVIIALSLVIGGVSTVLELLLHTR
jgi:hypothetical protein